MFRKLAEKHLLLPASPAKDFVTGEGFDYLGRHYRLQLTADPPDAMVKLARGRLRMSRTVAERGEGKGAMVGWYRQRARCWLPRRITAWAGRMSLHPGELDIRDLGYRWGSLGKNDRLNIHWAAMQLPVSLLEADFVVSLRAHAEKKRMEDDRFVCALRVLKDKRRGPTWHYEELYTGPAGLC